MAVFVFYKHGSIGARYVSQNIENCKITGWNVDYFVNQIQLMQWKYKSRFTGHLSLYHNIFFIFHSDYYIHICVIMFSSISPN